MAKIRNFDSFGGGIPTFFPDKGEIWHGGADRRPVPNLTFIGATYRFCGANKPIFGPLSKNNTGMVALRGHCTPVFLYIQVGRHCN